MQDKIKRHCLLLALLAVALSARRAEAVLSDSLFVNYGMADNETQYSTDEGELISISYSDDTHIFPSLKLGFVVFYEPDGKTLSDILLSHEDSIALFSDGSIGSLSGFVNALKSGNRMTPPAAQLGSFNETEDGITMQVGDLFGIAKDNIVVFSDGEHGSGSPIPGIPPPEPVPEPGEAISIGLIAAGIAVRGRRRK